LKSDRATRRDGAEILIYYRPFRCSVGTVENVPHSIAQIILLKHCDLQIKRFDQLNKGDEEEAWESECCLIWRMSTMKKEGLRRSAPLDRIQIAQSRLFLEWRRRAWVWGGAPPLSTGGSGNRTGGL